MNNQFKENNLFDQNNSEQSVSPNASPETNTEEAVFSEPKKEEPAAEASKLTSEINTGDTIFKEEPPQLSESVFPNQIESDTTDTALSAEKDKKERNTEASSAQENMPYQTEFVKLDSNKPVSQNQTEMDATTAKPVKELKENWSEKEPSSQERLPFQQPFAEPVSEEYIALNREEHRTVTPVDEPKEKWSTEEPSSKYIPYQPQSAESVSAGPVAEAQPEMDAVTTEPVGEFKQEWNTKEPSSQENTPYQPQYTGSPNPSMYTAQPSVSHYGNPFVGEIYPSASNQQTVYAPTNANYQGYGYNYNDVTQHQSPVSSTSAYQNPTFTSEQSVSKPKKAKKKSSLIYGKVAAIALVCALAGGAIGGSATYLIIGNETSTISNSSNTAQSINIDESYNSSVEAIADKVLPSVVGIQATFQATTGGFFGQSSVAQSEGSGIVYREDGYIITNYHVVSDASNGGTINVYLNENRDVAYPATIVGYDASADLAVLKIEATGLTPIEIGDSDAVKVGQVAVAIGNPGGLDFMGSVSQGIVSGLNRTLTTENGVEMNLLQTDAAINPGNSGGALVDGTGKLIGVNSAKLGSTDSSTSFEGMGFAIPVNDVVEICDRLIANEGKKKAYMGVSIDTRYTADVLEQMGYPAGVVVSSVTEDSPAEAAGLRQQDIIVSMDGVALTSYDILSSEISKHDVGDTVILEIYRLGSTTEISLTLGETSAQ